MSTGQLPSNFYVRRRGRVTGPYALPGLLSLKQRGTLGRFDELSTDAVKWVPAHCVPGVFGPGAPVIIDPAEPEPEPRQPVVCTGVGMYYQQNGKTVGPMPLAQLETLANEGKVSSQAVVWGEGDGQSFLASAHPYLPYVQWADGPGGKNAGNRASGAPAKSGCGMALVIGAVILLGAGIGLSIWLSSNNEHSDTPGGKPNAPPSANDTHGGVSVPRNTAPKSNVAPKPNVAPSNSASDSHK